MIQIGEEHYITISHDEVVKVFEEYFERNGRKCTIKIVHWNRNGACKLLVD